MTRMFTWSVFSVLISILDVVSIIFDSYILSRGEIQILGENKDLRNLFLELLIFQLRVKRIMCV